MSSRKLQQEYDKLQKKVTEGLQQFEEIYEKIGVTENPSLKDKLEGELRKEMKKLQRHRDQVKQWLSDSSNKLDKSVLLDTRGRIENAMERFKEVEKVSKMKQFSNEGLELQTKLGARGLDEAKKNEAAKYIVEVLDELNRQNELLSGEMAQYSHKKRLVAAQLAVADLTAKFDRNSSHILKLELVLRNLENDQLEPERIDDIKDDLDYYIENNQASDFVDYGEFYELLELDETVEILPNVTYGHVTMELQPEAQLQPSSTVAPAPAANVSDAHDLKHSEDAELKPHKPATAAESQQPKMTITIGNSIDASSNVASAPISAPASATTAPTLAAPSSAPAGTAASASSNTNSRAPPPGLKPQSKPTTSVHAPSQSAPTQPKVTVAEELKKKALTHAASAAAAAAACASASTLPASKRAPASQSTPLSTSGSARAAPAALADGHSLASPLPVLAKAPRAGKLPFWDNSAKMAELAQSRLSNPLPFHVISLQLEASLLNCPDSFDLERPRQYNPINVHPSSVDYPQEPMFELNSASIMKKFDTDTLFFCFYYNETQDALSKWNAARELSRRRWVFNLETKQWFSKDDRPKSRSVLGRFLDEDGIESAAASYKYFDYESSWLVRRKDHFHFERELQHTF